MQVSVIHRAPQIVESCNSGLENMEMIKSMDKCSTLFQQRFSLVHELRYSPVLQLTCSPVLQLRCPLVLELSCSVVLQLRCSLVRQLGKIALHLLFGWSLDKDKKVWINPNNSHESLDRSKLRPSQTPTIHPSEFFGHITFSVPNIKL